LAEKLQEKHSTRRDEIEQLQQRLESDNCLDKKLSEDWLWAKVKPVAELKELAPATVTAARDRTRWAKDERNRLLAIQLEKLDSQLRCGIELRAEAEGDALHLTTGNRKLLSKFGLTASEAKFVAAIWNQILRQTNITASTTAKALVSKLLNFRNTDDAGLRKTILMLSKNIDKIDGEIAKLETDINKLIYKLYGLTRKEIKLVENPRQ
jgi:hypothetical protein